MFIKILTESITQRKSIIFKNVACQDESAVSIPRLDVGYSEYSTDPSTT